MSDFLQNPDAEDVRWALKHAFESEAFRAKLTQVWERKGGTEPRFPEKVYRSQKVSHEAYPCIEIDLTIGRNTDNRNIVIDLQYEVHIFWHDRHDVEEELEDFISRYLTATREFFETTRRLPKIGNPDIIMGDDQFSPFVAEDVYEGRPLVKSGMIVMLVEVLRNHDGSA